MWDIKREGGSERDQTEGLNFRIPSYTCQLSRLRVENFDLTPAHACGPICHA